MGHSEITHNFQNKMKKVPDNLVLVFTTKCGTAFSENTFFRPILKNTRIMNNYLKSSNTFKNVHIGGSEYADQLIKMPHISEQKGIPHGVYNLPINIQSINRPPVLFNAKSNQEVRLSTILKFLSRKVQTGTGIVFGLFCRSIEGTNYPSYASTHPKNFVFVGNRVLPRNTSMYERLRPVSVRKPVQNALLKAKKTKNLFKKRVRSARSFTPRPRTPFQRILSIFSKNVRDSRTRRLEQSRLRD